MAVHLALDLTEVADRGRSSVRLALYPKVFARSIVTADAAAAPTRGALSTTVLLHHGCLTALGPTVLARFGIASSTADHLRGTVAVRCGGEAPTLTLRCSGASCDGVYPLVVTTLVDGTPVARTCAFVTIVERPVRQKVVVAPVVDLAASTVPTQAEVDAATDVASAAAGRRAAVTVAPAPSLLGRAGLDDQRLVAALTALDHRHDAEILDAPYVDIDPGALRRVGLGAEVRAQQRAGSRTLSSVGLTRLGPWIPVTSDLPAVPSVSGLATAGVHEVVVPSSAVAGSADLGQQPTSPFRLVAHNGTSVTAAVEVDQVASLARTTTNPRLLANQLLGALTFGYFEFPGLPDRRGDVVVIPSTLRGAPEIVDSLLAGLATNPVLTPVRLSRFFHVVPVGGNGVPRVRTLTSTAGNPIAPAVAAALADRRSTVDSVASMLIAAPSVADGFDHQLLGAERAGLIPSATTAALGALDHGLRSLLSSVAVPAEGVTMTSRDGSIPIALVSTEHVPLSVLVHLHSDRLRFTAGDLQTVVVRSPSTTLRLEVHADTTGDLPVTVTVTSPDGHLQLSQSLVTVQIAAFSHVGIVLTLLAAGVLGWWWFRTWRRSREEKRRG